MIMSAHIFPIIGMRCYTPLVLVSCFFASSFSGCSGNPTIEQAQVSTLNDSKSLYRKVFENGNDYEGQRLRFKVFAFIGYDTREEKLGWCVLEKGYAVSADLREPLSRSISKEEEFWIEGEFVTAAGSVSFSPANSSTDQLVRIMVLEDATVEFIE